MKRMSLLLLVVTMMTATPVYAELAPEQFAFGLPLAVAGEQAFYELELPLDVYQESQRPDLGDLRVFNAAGQVVPHALRQPDNKRYQQDVATSALPFFPLPARRTDDNLSVHIERTEAGTIVDVRSGSGSDEAEAERVSGYLLDASHLKQRIDSLELLWADDAAAFLAEVTIETSDDLVIWNALTKATVGWLQYKDFRLDQNQVVLPRTNRRYLRLRWRDGQFAESLAQVTVLTRESSIIERPALRRLLRDTVLVGDGLYQIDLRGALPVATVSVILPDKNSLASVRVISARDEKGTGVTRWQGLAYNISINEQIFSGRSFSVTPLRHRLWTLQVEKSEAPLPNAPRLEFSWQPDRLVFLAQGEGPYFIAYGSNVVEPTSFHIGSLLKLSGQDGVQSFKPGMAIPGKSYELGGRGRLSGRAPLPWGEYALWGVLSLGVILIGWMSISLQRKLREEKPDEGELE